MLDISTSNSVVAERLKDIINDKSLKQSSLAVKAGFTAQELNDMLNGRRIMRAVDILAIVNIVQELGIDANYLFGIKGGEEK